MAEATRPIWPGLWDQADDRAPRRRSLSRATIVETALEIVDHEGLDALSMRRIAQELNTGPASLYAHISNKEQLVELVLDQVYADLVHPVPDPGCWQQQFKDFARQARDVLVAHNDISKVAIASNIPTLPHALDATETMIGLLRAGGLAEQVIAYGVDLVGMYLVAAAYELSERSGPKASPEHAEVYLQGVRDYFASLPPERYPLLIAMIPALTHGAGDERFDFGLDVILAGLRVQSGQ